MSFNKQDLIWSDDVDSLESAFFWWDEPDDFVDTNSKESPGNEEELKTFGDELDDEIFDEDKINGQDGPGGLGLDETGGAEPTSAYSQFARFGPGEKAKSTSLSFDRSISTFVNRLPAKAGANTQPYGIHGVKAAISLIAYPHKILEQKKTRRSDPSVYVVVDSYSSYYPDKGVFLNLFASTCERLKMQTWRAEKLVNDFECAKANKRFKGKLLKCDWARKAGIVAGATVVFVGDGCNGNVGDGFWLNHDLVAFKKLYNPIWISMFPHGRNCGCTTTRQTEICGWKMYYGVTNVADLKLKRII